MPTSLEDVRQEADPFGAKVLEDGRTRFRVWMPQQAKVVGLGAPSPDSVLTANHPNGRPAIWLADSDETLEMEEIGEGWYELVTDKAGHGTAYMVECWNHYYDPGWTRFPDPATRWQAQNVHGPSVVVDPKQLDWSGELEDWKGVAQEDLVIYELHVGTFSKEGTLKSAIEKLDYLAELGITAVELMPMGGVGCTNNWGYDEVAKGAVHNPYGTPQDMVNFVKECHKRGIGVITDQVDNHNGSEGNYPWMHTPEMWAFEDFKNIEKQGLGERKTAPGSETPWGTAFDYSRWEIRKLALQKNRWWQEVYRTDGVRRDAVHAIHDALHEADPAHPHLLEELRRQSEAIARGQGKHFITVVENEHNKPSELKPEAQAAGTRARGNAQWADDFHHAVRALLFRGDPAAGFMDKGYYQPYNKDPLSLLREVLERGAAFSMDTPRNHHKTPADEAEKFDPRRHVNFTANHDTAGNTPHGERIERLLDRDPHAVQKLKLMATVLLLSPAIPMIFMGQERALKTPFPFFADWDNEGTRAGTKAGRQREFAQYGTEITDPGLPETAASAKLPWPGDEAREDETKPEFQNFMFGHYRELIALRKAHIAPHLESGVKETRIEQRGDVLKVEWEFGDGARFGWTANLGNKFGVKPQPTISAVENASASFGNSTKPMTPWSIEYAATPPHAHTMPQQTAAPHMS